MSRYIDATDIAKQIADFKRVVNSPNSDYMTGYLCALSVTEGMITKTPTADVVEVVRCKDCKHFQPDFVMTGDGDRRPYTDEEIKKGKMVTGDVGINCASRCERFGYWEENKIPVWFSENDYCSYGERK